MKCGTSSIILLYTGIVENCKSLTNSLFLFCSLALEGTEEISFAAFCMFFRRMINNESPSFGFLTKSSIKLEKKIPMYDAVSVSKLLILAIAEFELCHG